MYKLWFTYYYFTKYKKHTEDLEELVFILTCETLRFTA